MGNIVNEFLGGRKPLEKGNHTGKETYSIEKLINCGGNALIYLAKGVEDKKEYIIKETYPNIPGLTRDDNGNIKSIFKETGKTFENVIARAKKEQDKIKMLTGKEGAYTDYVQWEIENFEENGTFYAVSEYRAYKPLPKNNLDLYSALHYIRRILFALEAIHDAKLLHLDISPGNILQTNAEKDEPAPVLKIIDFGSAYTLGELQYIKGAPQFTQSGDFTAPELRGNVDIRKVGYWSDIYSVGKIFCHLIGIKRNAGDNRVIERKDKCVTRVNQAAIELANELIIKSLHPTPSETTRYPSAGEMRAVVDEAIKNIDMPSTTIIDGVVKGISGKLTIFTNSATSAKIANDNETESSFLFSLKEINKEYFKERNRLIVGRDNELWEIHTAFANDCRTVVITGLGGIGKTKLAYEYADCMSSFFEVPVQRITMGDIEETDERKQSFIEIVLNKIDYPFNLQLEMKSLPYNEQLKLRRAYLKSLNNKTLIVIDNANDIKREDIRALTEYPCCFLVTSRKEKGSISYQKAEIIELEQMGRDDLQDLFEQSLGRSLKQEECEKFHDLYEKLYGHTMTIDLTAHLMRDQMRTFDDIINILDNIKNEDGDIYFTKINDQSDENKTIYAHLHALFDMTSLNFSEKRVLSCLSLISLKGVRVQKLLSSLNLKNSNELLTLKRAKWINYDGETVRLHPLLSRLFFIDIPPADSDCNIIIDMVCDIMNFDNCDNFSAVHNVMDYGVFLYGRLSELKPVPLCEILLNKLAEGHNHLGDYTKSRELALSMLSTQAPKTVHATRTIYFVGIISINQWNHAEAIEWFENAYRQSEHIELPVSDKMKILHYLQTCYIATNDIDKMKWVNNEIFNVSIDNKLIPLAITSTMFAAVHSPIKINKSDIEKRLEVLFPICLEQMDNEMMGMIMYIGLYVGSPYFDQIGIYGKSIKEIVNSLVKVVGSLDNDNSADAKFEHILEEIEKYAKKNGIDLDLFYNYLNAVDDESFLTKFIIDQLEYNVNKYKEFGIPLYMDYMYKMIIQLSSTPIVDDKNMLIDYVEKKIADNIEYKLPAINFQTIQNSIAKANYLGSVKGADEAIRILNDSLKVIDEVIPTGNKYLLADIHENLAEWYSKMPNASELVEDSLLKTLQLKESVNISAEERAERLIRLGNISTDASKAIYYYSLSLKNLENENIFNCTRCIIYNQLINRCYHGHKKIIDEYITDSGNISGEIEFTENYYSKLCDVRNNNSSCTMDCSKEMTGNYNCVMGLYYYDGDVINQDYNNAVKYFTEAASYDSRAAQYLLGNCFYFGKGVAQNYKKAIEMYQKASKQGHQGARSTLGLLYYYGYGGVEQNYFKAYEHGYTLPINLENIQEIYSFPSKYYTGDAHYEFALIEDENGVLTLTDQGKTYEMLETLFNIDEPNVQKNIMAILAEFKVYLNNKHLIISFKDDGSNRLIITQDQLFRCVSLLNKMFLFYTENDPVPESNTYTFTLLETEPTNNYSSNDITARYSIYANYCSEDVPVEFILVNKNDKFFLSDQGRTYKMLNNIFELKEADVQNNLNAILNECEVLQVNDEFLIELSNFDGNIDLNTNEKLNEAFYRLLECISFMDTMRIFYV